MLIGPLAYPTINPQSPIWGFDKAVRVRDINTQPANWLRNVLHSQFLPISNGFAEI